MLHRISIVLALFIQVFGDDDCQYRKYNSKHTACLPPNSPCAIIKTGITENDQLFILNIHNDYRNKIANGSQDGLPTASNMNQLVWDDELAAVAQKHTNQCVFSHDCPSCRRVDRFPWVGQNIYQSKWIKIHSKSQWPKAIGAWFGKVRHFTRNQIRPARITNGNGHFTTLSWATSYAIGCGYTAFKNTASDKQQYPVKQVFTCNYGPGGNKQGHNKGVYKIGQPCSECQKNYECRNDKYPALCLATVKF